MLQKETEIKIGQISLKTMHQVTIVMYHYVRPIQKSLHPKIHGLELSEFEGQLEFFQKHYTPVTMEELIYAKLYGGRLPKNALVLTFDDGYLDHYTYVFPRLQKLGWQGSFFPPETTVFDEKVLDVNKVHFIIAAIPNLDTFVPKFFSLLKNYRKDYDLLSDDEYLKLATESSRFDNRNVMLIKRMLQKFLPNPIRGKILDTLFMQYVSTDENLFSRQLYMNVDQLTEMRRGGMHIGGHGYDHGFMDMLSDKELDQEIDSSLRVLHAVGAETKAWVMCYPYGVYTPTLLDKLQKRNCVLGLTAEVNIAQLSRDSALELPRLDTNDLPKSSVEPPNAWVHQVE